MSYNILLEFRQLAPPQVEQISQSEGFWFTKTLIETFPEKG